MIEINEIIGALLAHVQNYAFKENWKTTARVRLLTDR